MGLLDIVVLTPCHEISGIIAVHNKQFNFIGLLAAAAMLSWTGAPGNAATMAQPSKPDPLLDGGPTAPCAAGADYAAGIDTAGQAVIPADVAAGRVPLPDAVAIPLGNTRGGNRRRAHAPVPNGDSAYVSLDGKKLEPLLNPAPCIDPGR
jgi:hypothetical protein